MSHLFEVTFCFIIEKIQNRWCLLQELFVMRVFGVQDAQGIGMIALLTLWGELIKVGMEILFELVFVLFAGV